MLHQSRLLLLNGNKIFLFLLLILILIHLKIFASDSNLQRYKKGLNYFNNKRYAQTILELDSELVNRPELRENVMVLLALSHFFIGNYYASDSIINLIEKEFPNTSYKEKILETKLAIGLHKKSKEKILASFYSLDSLDIAKSKWKDYEKAFDGLLDLFDEFEILKLSKNIYNPTLKFALIKSLFNYSIDKLNSKQIPIYYNELINLNRNNEFFTISRIGVIIHTNKEDLAVETNVLEGLKYSIDEFNRENKRNLELVIFKDSTEKLKMTLKKFSKDLEILCVIGPLYSDQFSELAEDAHKLSLPIISPTATLTEIAHRSKFIYQFNPSLEVRGSALAEYVLRKFGMTRVGVLSSNAKFIKPTYYSFKNKISDEKNVELIFDLSWNENTNAVKSIIRDIRKIALDKDYVIRFNPSLDMTISQKLISMGLDESKLDSLKREQAEVSVFELFGKYGYKICVANKIPIFKRTVNFLDSLHIPVYSIDAIILFISKPEIIPALSNEIQRQNIVTKLLGNDIWNSPENLLKGYPSTNGVIFTSDAYFNDEDFRQKIIRERMALLKSANINRNFYYGYETMRKITFILKEDVQRHNFYNILVGDSKYEGVLSDIILNEDGVNSAIFILEYNNRKVIKLDRIIIY